MTVIFGVLWWFIIGFPLAGARVLSGSLWPSVAGHAMLKFLAVFGG